MDALTQPHPFPGKLIVVEGIDGSGKSTQLLLAMRYLQARGLKPFFTEWNSADLVKAVTKKGKKKMSLTPMTFSLLHATDFAFRLVHNILPPLKDAWNQPAFNKPNQFWSGQPLGALYAKLAPQVPAQYTAPEIDTAKAKLSEALVACVGYYNQHGDDAGFDPFVRATLKRCADRVRAIKARNPY